jgi:hypothetical protein
MLEVHCGAGGGTAGQRELDALHRRSVQDLAANAIC